MLDGYGVAVALLLPLLCELGSFSAMLLVFENVVAAAYTGQSIATANVLARKHRTLWLRLLIYIPSMISLFESTGTHRVGYPTATLVQSCRYERRISVVLCHDFNQIRCERSPVWRCWWLASYR